MYTIVEVPLDGAIPLYMRNSANYMVGRETLHKGIQSTARPMLGVGVAYMADNGRELYEAARTAAKEAQDKGAAIPFDVFLGRIEQLLGRELSDEEERKVASAFVSIGWLYSYDKKNGKRPVSFELEQ
ncbi:MAG: hypothetical protein LVQ95_01215 [Candidatus Micrarchaeales archaeon]|nr:hypothetical protein [Candidatus Micrarchaeales archaeon]